jgi:regulator of CtrA degradation
MQLASWLLLHRAVNEGEMSLAQAKKEKAKVRVWSDEGADREAIIMLPEKLKDLVDRSMAIQGRVRRLDSTIHAGPTTESAGNPGGQQISYLRDALNVRA